MKYFITLCITFTTLMFGCTSETDSNESQGEEITGLTEAQYKAKGAGITAAAQGALLGKVNKAIAEGGTHYAVEFCNIQASGLVDSLNKVYECEIARVTNRKRNPDNKIETDYDKIAWNYFLTNQERKATIDTILFEQATHPIYYKPIFIGMETCLKCHGSRSKDIELATLEKIDSLYPTDAAVNYTMGELRGMWKVKL